MHRYVTATAIGFAAGVLLSCGTAATAKRAVPERPALTFGTSGAQLQYVVLGDSTAAGEGGTYDRGIAVTTAAHLGQTRRVTMNNFSVSGARMRDVRASQLPLAEAARPDVVLLSAGANDVTHLSGTGGMREDLREIVRRLRAANPEVNIVITGSPDMGSPPRIPRLLRGLAARRTESANRMFRAEAEDLDLTFAPIAARTGSLFRNDPTLFHEDRFHPNDRGYATWIAVLNEALTSAMR
jgi:acyl-CoA thioesterase I